MGLQFLHGKCSTKFFLFLIQWNYPWITTQFRCTVSQELELEYVNFEGLFQWPKILQYILYILQWSVQYSTSLLLSMRITNYKLEMKSNGTKHSASKIVFMLVLTNFWRSDRRAYTSLGEVDFTGSLHLRLDGSQKLVLRLMCLAIGHVNQGVMN